MPWVVKNPKRPDFCGCPPCPLCFDWQTEAPAGRVQDKWVAEIIAGMSKFTQDMVGTKTPTANEIEVLNQAAEAIHVGNLTFSTRVDEELKSADKAQHTERQINQLLADKRADAERPKAPDAKPCLDEMDLSKINEPPPANPTFFVYGSSALFGGPDIEKFYESSFSRLFGVPAEALEKAPVDDKERRRIQAEADAKKRMKAQARGYAKVWR